MTRTDFKDSGIEVVYHEVRAHGSDPTARIDLMDWRDWLSAPEMEFDKELTLLVTEVEPSDGIQDSLQFVSPGLWSDYPRWGNTIYGANFLLYLPLELPLPEKEARCRAAKQLMESLEFPSEVPIAPRELSAAAAQALERLRVWREVVGAARGIPAIVIFSDNALRAIAAKMPGTLDELRSIYGLSDYQLDKYGEAILKTLAGSD